MPMMGGLGNPDVPLMNRDASDASQNVRQEPPLNGGASNGMGMGGMGGGLGEPEGMPSLAIERFQAMPAAAGQMPQGPPVPQPGAMGQQMASIPAQMPGQGQPPGMMPGQQMMPGQMMPGQQQNRFGDNIAGQMFGNDEVGQSIAAKMQAFQGRQGSRF